MAKITKAALIKCAEEVNKEWKMKPALLTKGTVTELEENQLAEIIPDLKDDDTFTPETQAVIDYLKAKAAPVEVEKEEKKEETAKEKKAREKAEKKAAKEKEVQEEPEMEATLADQVRGEMKKDVLIDFVNNEKEFKKHRKGLLGMKNHLAMRKQMSLILTGEKPNFEEVKKEKKEKVVNPLIAEVKTCEKKKKLKKLAKVNKEFKGVEIEGSIEEIKAVLLKALEGTKVPKVKKGKGVIAMIAKIIEEAKKKEGVSKDEMLEALVEAFPNREKDAMKKTVNVQVPNRITKERFEVKKLKNGNYCKA